MSASTTSAGLRVATVSFFPDLHDSRYLCAQEFCRSAARERLPVIVVDDSPQHDVVKETLEKHGCGFVSVRRQGNRGRKGVALRESIEIAARCAEAASCICITEIEKVDLLRHAATLAAPILSGSADVVVPRRETNAFARTYAIEQFHSESFGNEHVRLLLAQGGLKVEGADWLFGPLLFAAHLAEPFWLRYDGEQWDAQFVPVFRAFRAGAAKRILSVEIDYAHHPLQKAQEEGDSSLCTKRLRQLQYLVPIIERDWIHRERLRIVVTGAMGNIGLKVTNHLLKLEGADRLDIVLLDIAPELPADLHGTSLTYIRADLRQWSPRWVRCFDGAHTVFHLAAQNPFPEASSADSAASMSINTNVLLACAEGGVARTVFASSNHVCGGYRTETGADPTISPSDDVRFGTILPDGQDSTRYAAAKVQGEALLCSLVAAGRVRRGVALRVGWCQPGENHPRTMTASGTPTVEAVAGAATATELPSHDRPEAILRWFKSMWLSNGDLCRLVDCCMRWNAREGSYLAVNAMSCNKGMRWSDVGWGELNYVPEDDAFSLN